MGAGGNLEDEEGGREASLGLITGLSVLGLTFPLSALFVPLLSPRSDPLEAPNRIEPTPGVWGIRSPVAKAVKLTRRSVLLVIISERIFL